MKVLKSGAGFTQAGQDELSLLRCVSDLFCYSILTSYAVFRLPLLSLTFLHPVVSLNQAGGPTSRHPSSQRIVQLLDEFKLAGVNGIRILFSTGCHSLGAYLKPDTEA